MATIVLICVSGFIGGAVIGYLVSSVKKSALEARVSMLGDQLRSLQMEAEKKVKDAKEEAKEQLNTAKADAEDALRKAEERYNALVEQQKKQHQQDMQIFREQLENDARKILEDRQNDLQKGNSTQLDAILSPLKEKLAEMKNAFDESKKASHQNSASFETQMKNLMMQSQQLGEDAKHLTEALKNKGKVQGDWGEQMLSKILEDSGLRKGFEYEMQENVKDEEGNNLRPDVIVHCSDGRNVIIDSKVSLTGFYNYVSAQNDEERQKAEKENLDSIKKHIKELTDKNYAKLVENAVPTVLMFIPNEGSYILALQKNPEIANEAFRQNVLLINPTNLMLALNLIVQLWQWDRKEENDRKIVETATEMYDKFCIFADTFEKMGNQLKTVQTTYTTAVGQLKDGRGNLIKRIDQLQNLGVTSTKQIPKSLKNE